MSGLAPIDALSARAYRIPTDALEADGTLDWNATTMVVVFLSAGGVGGMGYAYTDAAAAGIVEGTLADEIVGSDAADVPRIWGAMRRRVRNMGASGVAASAISAVDVALWDLKARLLGLPLADLWGARREAVPIYGSGGFTSYDDARLTEQLARFVGEAGCARVKMKIGADRRIEEQRIRLAKEAIGDATLMIDANGATTPREALAIADIADGHGVDWFEEPVTSDDLEGLAQVRAALPGAIDCAAGEYAFGPHDVRRLLEARAVDCLQIDATRCMGYTGFLQAAALAEAFAVPISAHTAPALHLPVCRARGGSTGFGLRAGSARNPGGLGGYGRAAGSARRLSAGSRGALRKIRLRLADVRPFRRRARPLPRLLRRPERRGRGELGALPRRGGGSRRALRRLAVGRARGRASPRRAAREDVFAFRAWKALWDPKGLMNPGKIVDPYPATSNLRLGPSYRPDDPKTSFSFVDEGGFVAAAERCVGVGKCRRTSSESGVMCPSYMVTREEKHSTRGRARLLFEMLHGTWRR